jgi:hypothetical protein
MGEKGKWEKGNAGYFAISPISPTSNGSLLAIGDGGRGERFRYFLHPVVIGMMGKDTPEARALLAALESDPGVNKAAAKAMFEMFDQD